MASRGGVADVGRHHSVFAMKADNAAEEVEMNGNRKEHRDHGGGDGRGRSAIIEGGKKSLHHSKTFPSEA